MENKPVRYLWKDVETTNDLIDRLHAMAENKNLTDDQRALLRDAQHRLADLQDHADKLMLHVGENIPGHNLDKLVEVLVKCGYSRHELHSILNVPQDMIMRHITTLDTELN